ncbi:MAG: hypothetical protein JKY60_13605 [Kordiimonadaceae bacterium]|nr:hypothetical protein [Kordiimonadaceae bacterium]
MREKIEVLILITLTIGFAAAVTLVPLDVMPYVMGTLGMALTYIVLVLLLALFMVGFDGENAGRWTFQTRFRRHEDKPCTCEK